MFKKVIRHIIPVYTQATMVLTLGILILLLLFDEGFMKALQPSIDQILINPWILITEKNFSLKILILLLGIFSIFISIFQKKKPSSRLKYYMIGFAMMVDMLISYYSIKGNFKGWK